MIRSQIETKHVALAALLATAGLAWWWTVARMAGMDAAPGADLGSLGWFTGSWVVMMTAMMLPSFGPAFIAYLTPMRAAGPSRWVLFTGGYLLVWAFVGVFAYAAFELGKQLLGSELAWHRAGRWLAVAVLAGAAGYEFAPLKQACLARCRGRAAVASPLAQQRRSGALGLGMRSGGWCIGCSGALMAALFALGAMSLTWMVVIAALIALEKVGPWPLSARIGTAIVLASLAVGLAVAPDQIPGLVMPGAAGMHAMSAMH